MLRFGQKTMGEGSQYENPPLWLPKWKFSVAPRLKIFLPPYRTILTTWKLD